MNANDFNGAAGTPNLDDDVLATINAEGSPAGVSVTSHAFGLDGDAAQGVSVGVGSPSHYAAITVQDASTAVKGVFQLNDADFTVTGGVVTLDGEIAVSFTAEGSPGVAIPAAGILNIVGGEGIDTNAPASPNATMEINPENASTTNKGFFNIPADGLTISSGAVDLTGDVIKSVNTDGASVTPATHTVTLAGNGGQGVSTSDPGASPGNDIEITIQNASTSQKGVFQLNPDDFDVSGSPPGIVSLDGTVLNSVASDSGTATPSTGNFNIEGGTGIVTSGSGANITIAGVNATAGTGSPAPTKGIFSLEADASSPDLLSDFAVDGNTHVTLAANVLQSVTTDGLAATPAAGAMSIVGGEGVDVTGASDTVTVAFENATTDDASPVNKGAAQYNATSFDLGSPADGDVSIATDGIQDTHIDWGDGAGQVSASDWVTDANASPGLGWSPAVSNVQDALESTEAGIDALEERQVDQFTLASGDITAKSIQLSAEPTSPAKTVLVVKSGVAQQYADDFEIAAGSPSTLSWDGLGLDGVLETGDKITVVYAI